MRNLKKLLEKMYRKVALKLVNEGLQVSTWRLLACRLLHAMKPTSRLCASCALPLSGRHCS